MKKHLTRAGSKNETQQSRVFVIDNNRGVSVLLRHILESGGFRVDTFVSAQEFLSCGGVTRTGCVLMDLEMPDMNSLQLQRELHRHNARLAVVVMASGGLVTAAVEAMKAGAIDFLEKPFSAAELLNSVRRAQEFIARTAASSSLVEDACRRIALLTRREKDVFDLLVSGSSNKTAAQVLRISPRTVEVHRAHAVDKMGTKNLMELVRMSIAGMKSDRAA